MDHLRDPQGLATPQDIKHINYLVRAGCTVIFDSFGVRVQQAIIDGQSKIGTKKIRRLTLHECVNAFNKNEWEK